MCFGGGLSQIFFSDPVSWIRMFKHMRLIGLFDGIDEGLVIPDSSTFNETILTDSRGSFNYTFIPEDVGSWSIYASCSGNRNYEGTFSLTISFIVEPFLKPADFRVADLSRVQQKLKLSNQSQSALKLRT